MIRMSDNDFQPLNTQDNKTLCGRSRGVMVKTLDSGIVVSELRWLPDEYTWEGMNTLILPTMY